MDENVSCTLSLRFPELLYFWHFFLGIDQQSNLIFNSLLKCVWSVLMSNDKIHVRVFFNLSQYVCVLCMRGVAFTERGRPLADVINRAGKRSQTKGCK